MKKSSILVLALGIVFAGFIFYSLFRVQPVKVLNSRLERDGAEVAVAGTVENTARREAAVDLEVHYFDSAGREIGQNTLRLRHLHYDRRRAFKSPERDLPGVAAFSLDLNKGRNPYGN